MNAPAWREVVREVIEHATDDAGLVPEWAYLALGNWLAATEGQPVSLEDFIAYVGAIAGHPVETLATTENLSWQEIVSWLPSSVGDAASDLLADMRNLKA